MRENENILRDKLNEGSQLRDALNYVKSDRSKLQSKRDEALTRSVEAE
jgi:hypothetical protein